MGEVLLALWPGILYCKQSLYIFYFVNKALGQTLRLLESHNALFRGVAIVMHITKRPTVTSLFGVFVQVGLWRELCKFGR